MKKGLLTVFAMLFGMLASQHISAAIYNNASAYSKDIVDKHFAGRGPDKEFKFAVEEMTYDISSGEEFVMPELLNPHKLTINAYPYCDNTEAMTIVRDEVTHELKSVKVNPSFIGDVHIVATAKKSSKYGESTAECLLHIVNSAIAERIIFTSDDFETQKGNENGWHEESMYDVWSCQCSTGWYTNTWYKGITSYTYCDLVSPDITLAEGVNKIELIQALGGFTNPEADAQLLVREAGTAEWTVMEGMVYEHEGSSYDYYAAGAMSIPEELHGKTVQFAFRFGTDGSTNDPHWAIREVRLLKVAGDTPTAIDGIELKYDGNDAVYDLMGRRVANPADGIYVINGKKVVIR